jgi:hypothetical protein
LVSVDGNEPFSGVHASDSRKLSDSVVWQRGRASFPLPHRLPAHAKARS